MRFEGRLYIQSRQAKDKLSCRELTLCVSVEDVEFRLVWSRASMLVKPKLEQVEKSSARKSTLAACIWFDLNCMLSAIS